MQFNLADIFECVADTVPDREALICGERRLTFGQLDDRANRLGHHLLSRGVKPGDHLGIYMYNCSEWVEAMLATFKIGAVPVNINYRYVEEELRYLFDDADLMGVIYHGEFAPRVAAVASTLPALRTFVRVGAGEGAESSFAADECEAALAAAPAGRGFAARSGDALYLIYTGGTTGMPKGVMWRHEDLFFGGLQGGNPGGKDIERPEEIADIVQAKVGPTMLPAAPMMHGTGQWSCIIGLFGGGKVVLSPSRHFDAAGIWRMVQQEQVHVMSIVGDAMARPLVEALSEGAESYDTSSLLVLSSSGAILSPAVREQLRARLPNTLLLDNFGVSEAGHQGTGVVGPGAARPRFIVDHTTAVLDEHMQPIEPGSAQAGRLARKGHLPLGYYKDPEKTARTFVEANGTRWVLPGDMATIDADGAITLLGRGSICINSGGEKIYPEEVEAALKSHPAVFDAVVVGVPDERFGERVAAVVQTRPAMQVTFAEVDAHCRTKIAGYKAPRELHVVDEIVRQPSGKADYRWAKTAAMAGREKELVG